LDLSYSALKDKGKKKKKKLNFGPLFKTAKGSPGGIAPFTGYVLWWLCNATAEIRTCVVFDAPATWWAPASGLLLNQVAGLNLAWVFWVICLLCA
jgi:hypothetical protein